MACYTKLPRGNKDNSEKGYNGYNILTFRQNYQKSYLGVAASSFVEKILPEHQLPLNRLEHSEALLRWLQ